MNDDWDVAEAPNAHSRPTHRGEEPSAHAQEMLRTVEEFQRKVLEENEAREHGHEIKSYEFLGFIPMPASLGVLLSGIKNPLLSLLGQNLQKGAGSLLGNSAAAKTAQVTLGLATVLSEEIASVTRGMMEYKRHLSQTAGHIAPVLSELKGRHDLVGLMSVTQQENSVIALHRKRLGEKFSGDMIKNAVGVLGSSLSVYQNIQPTLREVGLGKKFGFIENDRLIPENAGIGRVVNDDVLNGLLGAVGNMQKSTIESNYKRTYGNPSALAMIVSLAEQLQDGPDTTEFEVPVTRQTLPLDQYIARMIKYHQEDVAKVDSHARPLRPALDEPLLEISQRLAFAIEEKRITPMMLVRIVGEKLHGVRLVKNNGRALAKIEEVERLIEVMGKKAQAYEQPSASVVSETLTLQDIKDGITHLKGDERAMLIAVVPDELSHQSGLSDQEIHAERNRVAPKLNEMFAEAVLALNAKDDKTLQEELHLAEADISTLREAAGAVQMEGAEALNHHRMSKQHPNGVDAIVLNVAIDKVQAGERKYLGTLREEGKKMLKEQSPAASVEPQEKEHASRVKQGRKRGAEAAAQVG